MESRTLMDAQFQERRVFAARALVPALALRLVAVQVRAQSPDGLPAGTIASIEKAVTTEMSKQGIPGLSLAIGGWILLGAQAEQHLNLLSDSFDPWMRLMQLAGLIGVVGTFPVIYDALRSWGNLPRWFWSKVGETAIAVACAGLTWFIFTWHLLALSLKY